MDEEMEDTVAEYTFTAVEIDLDYEFDAARYFDFSRDESQAEARQAELWFHSSAPDYPPSPFVAKMIPTEGVLMENVNLSPKNDDDVDDEMSESDSDVDDRGRQEVSAVEHKIRGGDGNRGGTFAKLQNSFVKKFQNQPLSIPPGLTFYSHMMKDELKPKTKTGSKPSFPRTSTLMKPTASHLAKQNQLRGVGDSRIQKPSAGNNDKGLSNPCGIEIQAAKRQKVEGGHLRKVAGAKQQTDFFHKLSKKGATTEGISFHSKLRITIPREPDLETAHRAERTRPKANKEAENVVSTVRRFKALPLNKKILEAPSMFLPKRSTPRLPEFQEFHLKTSERAVQHASVSSTSTFSCNNSEKLQVVHNGNSNSTAECRSRESGRSNLLDASKQERQELSQNYNILPLNKKVLSSKGHVGVFRSIKKETTVPMEFNFHTDKRVHHNPPLPVELFNKLSLTSESQQVAGSYMKVPPPTNVPQKGSKENRWAPFQQEHEMKHVTDAKIPSLATKHIQCHIDKGVTEAGSLSGNRRNLGIR